MNSETPEAKDHEHIESGTSVRLKQNRAKHNVDHVAPAVAKSEHISEAFLKEGREDVNVPHGVFDQHAIAQRRATRLPKLRRRVKVKMSVI